jgi:hypothetical protein
MLSKTGRGCPALLGVICTLVRSPSTSVPGKLFEYLYARRPILYIGYEHGITAEIIKERGAGLISNSPERIRDQLQAWVEDKRAGRLMRLGQSVSRGLSRDEQFCKLEPVFADILHEGRVSPRV